MANGPPSFEPPEVESTVGSLARYCRWNATYLATYRTWAIAAKGAIEERADKGDRLQELGRTVAGLKATVGILAVIVLGLVGQALAKVLG